MNNLYNSTDGVTIFIKDITNDGMTISKGTLILWIQKIANTYKKNDVNVLKVLVASFNKQSIIV